MKIDSITLHHIRMPYVAPFQTSRWTETDHECVLVELKAEGMTGWGECVANQTPTYSYETVKTNWLMLADFLLPAVFERCPDTVEEYRAALPRVTGHPMAKAGLEMALWDLFARRAGISLQTYLGGSGERVKVGVSVGIQPTTGELVETVGRYVRQGYERVKLKIKPGRDVEDVRAVRKVFPNLLLQVDANSAYRLGEAARLKDLDEFDLVLIEQPLDHDDIIDHAKLQPQLKTPLCLDESISSVVQACHALELGACRIINIKPGRVSGLHEGKLIHDACRALDAPVWMGGMLETGLGRAANVALASLPGFTLHGDISASSRYYHEDIIAAPFELNADSTLSVPQGIGLGVQVNHEVLKRVTVRREAFKG